MCQHTDGNPTATPMVAISTHVYEAACRTIGEFAIRPIVEHVLMQTAHRRRTLAAAELFESLNVDFGDQMDPEDKPSTVDGAAEPVDYAALLTRDTEYLATL